MYRCAAPAALALALSLAALPLTEARAQTAPGHRFFPAQALRGDLVVSAAPEVQLNGQADRLAPGSRIRGADNMLALPGALTGQKLTVHYTRDGSGLLMDVWVLNAVELANKPWPRTAKEAASWRFDAATQTWTKS